MPAPPKRAPSDQSRVATTRRQIKSGLLRARSQVDLRSDAPLLVTGAGRAGTTWIGEIVAALCSGALFFEPDHRRRGVLFDRYVDASQSTASRLRMYQALAAGQGANHWSVRDLRPFLGRNRLVVKSISATDIVPTLLSYEVFHRPVVVLRHPCAVAASRMVVHFTPPAPRRLLTERQLATYPQLEPLQDIASAHERYALQWALTYLAVAGLNDERIFVARYERFVDDPESQLERLAAHLRLGAVDHDEVDTDRPSIMDYRHDLQMGRAQLTKWQDRLTDTQVEEVLAVVRQAGITVYTDALMPSDEPLDIRI